MVREQTVYGQTTRWVQMIVASVEMEKKTVMFIHIFGFMLSFVM